MDEWRKPLVKEKTKIFLPAKGLAACAKTDSVETKPHALLGLGDLGARPALAPACRGSYAHDGDNYVDVCLALAAGDAPPAFVAFCAPGKELFAPKGARYPCVAQTLAIHAISDPPASEK